MKIFVLSTIIIFSTITNHVLAQSGRVDLSFNAKCNEFKGGDGPNKPVRSICLQPDGKILIAGEFTTYNQVEVNRIARLNPDGSLDSSFKTGSGVNATIHTVVIQSDGKILIGGEFTVFDGKTASRIARLNPDGSLDNSFHTGTGADNHVYTIALHEDGRILIGGEFTSYNGISKTGTARLNQDGSPDSTFTTVAGKTYDINIRRDQKIFMAGRYLTKEVGYRDVIVRLYTDGSIDRHFKSGEGASEKINSFIVCPDGKILVGGKFLIYDAFPCKHFISLNQDGTYDSTFLRNWIGEEIYDMAVQQDDKIIITGKPLEAYTGYASGICRINPDGSKDNTFNPGHGADGTIYTTVVLPDGKIIIGGKFRSYNNIQKKYLVRLNPDGTIDETFNAFLGTNNVVKCIAVTNDKIIIGGEFTSYNGKPANHIVRLNSDGSVDTTFKCGKGADASVEAIAIQDDGKIIIGGFFLKYDGISRAKIARLNPDGSLDNSFEPSSGFNNSVHAIAIQKDGKIIVGGYFTKFNNNTVNRLARLNPDGSLDLTFKTGTGADKAIYAIAIQNDGKILIAGQFSRYNRMWTQKITRIHPDGSPDLSFLEIPLSTHYIKSLAIQKDGKILIGGWFNHTHDRKDSNIVRLNPDGSRDNTFNTGKGANNVIQDIALQEDGKIIVVGNFTKFNETKTGYITRLNPDGSLDETFNPGTGANAWTNAVAIQKDGKIIVGGHFTNFDGNKCNRIVRLLR